MQADVLFYLLFPSIEVEHSQRIRYRCWEMVTMHESSITNILGREIVKGCERRKTVKDGKKQCAGRYERVSEGGRWKDNV